MDYLVYALLQKGDNQKAAQQKEYLDTIQKITPINFKVAYALAAIPARIALENKDWPTAATLAPPPIALRWQEFPWQEAILHFTRALGASHLGKIADAEKEMATLEALHQKLVAREMDYEANQVMVQLKASQAWLHFAKGNKEAAVASMQEAADLEDRTSKHPVTPGEVLPARELLGDLLLALGHPAAALTAYESTLKNTPGRFNSIYGAAIASQKLGRMEQAKGYFEKLLAASESVAVSRPEIAIAKGAVDE